MFDFLYEFISNYPIELSLPIVRILHKRNSLEDNIDDSTNPDVLVDMIWFFLVFEWMRFSGLMQDLEPTLLHSCQEALIKFPAKFLVSLKYAYFDCENRYLNNNKLPIRNALLYLTVI